MNDTDKRSPIDALRSALVRALPYDSDARIDELVEAIDRYANAKLAAVAPSPDRGATTPDAPSDGPHLRDAFWGVRYARTGGWHGRGFTRAEAERIVREWQWHKTTPIMVEHDPNYEKDLAAEGGEPHPPIGSRDYVRFSAARRSAQGQPSPAALSAAEEDGDA